MIPPDNRKRANIQRLIDHGAAAGKIRQTLGITRKTWDAWVAAGEIGTAMPWPQVELDRGGLDVTMDRLYAGRRYEDHQQAPRQTQGRGSLMEV
jgi:hypothetical protein